jgi:uncharacterized protein
MNSSASENKLGKQESAYLLQHKDNPVHWLPYGPEALKKAKDENKPIFLSVGYSSCHWCHVMAHESFEDQETADILNKDFICIKVDREEYPDLDQYYQQACQLFIQTGGWPLSAFLLPDMRPFFVGTYFSKDKRSDGGTTFKELLSELMRAYTQDQEKVLDNAEQVAEAIEKGLDPQGKVEFEGHFPHPEAILSAVKDFQDNENGGYGVAPKFPHFAFYEWAVEQIMEGVVSKEYGEHIVNSLERMFMGGIYDQARGGIHRYSTDDQYIVPHFEKMLYDQAGLLKTLSKLSVVFPSPLIFDALFDTLNYLKTEMQSHEGHFFSAQDADSEGVEGLYFTYTEEEFEDLINKASTPEKDLSDSIDQIKKWFRVSPEGNFEQKLNVVSLDPELKDEIFQNDTWDTVRLIRKQVLEERKNRIPPSTDNKGVASWNFLLLSGLVDVMQYCQIAPVKQLASDVFNQAVEGIYKTFLTDKENSGMIIRHTTTLEEGPMYSEDYICFAECMLRLYEISANPVFKENLEITLKMIENEFIHDGKILTRARSQSDEGLPPNQKQGPFDHSFKSSAATLVGLARRARVLFGNAELLSSLAPVQEEFTNLILKNPISAGEGLRACTYPDQAYRVMKVPASWPQKPEFVSMMGHLLPRFVLDYHRDENEMWQVCTLKACELQGEGIQSFIDTLRPPQNDDQEKEGPAKK